MRIEQIGDATLCTSIYALCEFPSWAPRYVGKTVQYIHERHKAHIRAAKRGSQLPVHYWIRKKIALQERLAVLHLEFVYGSQWAHRESWWIEKFRADGHQLLNLTNGGEGLSGHSPSESHRQKIAEALRTGGEFVCVACGTKFWRKANQIRKGQNKFCSRLCANVTNKGGRRVAT